MEAVMVGGPNRSSSHGPQFSLLELLLRHPAAYKPGRAGPADVWEFFHDTGSNVVDVYVNTCATR
jgi:DNA-binding response OmpR family regulator